MKQYLLLLKQAFQLLIEYFKEDTWDKIKAAFIKAFDAFKEILWNELKETVREQAEIAVKTAEEYSKSEQVKIKKEELISQIVDSIKLPFIFKPFKGMLKSYINKKVEAVIQLAIEKGHDFLSK